MKFKMSNMYVPSPHSEILELLQQNIQKTHSQTHSRPTQINFTRRPQRAHPTFHTHPSNNQPLRQVSIHERDPRLVFESPGTGHCPVPEVSGNFPSVPWKKNRVSWDRATRFLERLIAKNSIRSTSFSPRRPRTPNRVANRHYLKFPLHSKFLYILFFRK